jgi:hypothetical protein
VRFLRTLRSAACVIIALIGLTHVSAFAAAVHPVCTVHHEHCSKSATIKSCCDGDQSAAQDQTGPLTAKVSISAPSLAVAVLFPIVSAPDLTHALVRAQASPPRAAPVDFPTLFASLLI